MTDTKWLTNRHIKDAYTDTYPYKVVIGRPKASGTYTIEELEQMDMVGIYRVDDPIDYREFILSCLETKILKE